MALTCMRLRKDCVSHMSQTIYAICIRLCIYISLLEYVLSASTLSITLTRYPQVNPAEFSVSLQGDKAYRIIVIPTRIPHHGKFFEEYHSDGSFFFEKDTSRHTPFENCSDVYTRQK